MWIDGEVDAEDELPARVKNKKTTIDRVSYAPCLNTTMSCYFIDMGMPAARFIRTEALRTRGYMKQVEMVALHKQIVIDQTHFSLSMGQLAAVLLNRNIICDLKNTRAIVGCLCFEETNAFSSLCMEAPEECIVDIEEVCSHLILAFEVSPVALDRYGKKFYQTETMTVIREWYPRGCAQCIFNLAALMIKTTLCYSAQNALHPRVYEPRLPVLSDLVCSIACGYAFGSCDITTKHRLMHLMQTAMLLETRFSSVCVSYNVAIDEVLRLRIFKRRVSIDEAHTNQDNCLHAAISRYMKYDVAMVTPYVCVMMYIANEMFTSTGTDNIKFFIRPQKRITAHCILRERSTNRVIYYS
jgi:hypothetical protein